MIFKIIHITDLHFNPLNRIPQSRTEDFHQHIKNKWDGLCKAIQVEKESADEVIGIISGDIFHLKNSKLYYPEFLNKYVSMFSQTGIDWYSIPGNHDLPKSSYQLINTSAYQTLTMATPNLIDQSFKITPFDCGSVKINVGGFPFHPLKESLELLEDFNGEFDSSGFNVAIIHTDALPDDTIFTFWDIIGYDLLLDTLSNIDLVCLGHIHQSFPVYIRTKGSKKQMISKPWSFSRVVRDYFNQTDLLEKMHKPSYSLIKLVNEEGKFQVSVDYKEIPHEPFDVIFQKDDLKREIEKNEKVKGFIDQIKEQFGSTDKAFQVIDPDSYLRKIDIPENVREMIQLYLE